MSSMPPPKPPAKSQRVRTESQLNKKRLADRNKHRENRQEQKSRLASIEGDIADIKSALQKLTAIPRVERPIATVADTNGSDIASSPRSSLHATRLCEHISATDARIVNCQCGFQHFDRFDMLDVCSMTTLYQRQTPGPWGAAAIPRNPSLASAMLHSTDENTATFLITSCLRQYKMKSIELLLGFYLIGYRYMRWTMFPSVETLQDIPSWLWPTETQLMHAHSVVVDFLPWPRLRNYLCVSGDKDPRHSLSCYLESVEFLSPRNIQIFAQSDDGQINLSADFEAAVNDLANWRLGSPWLDHFPQLAHLITTT